MPCNTPPPPMMDEEMQEEIESAPELLPYEEDDEEDIIEIVENDDSDLTFESHSDAVFCCNFNKTGDLAVSGGQDEKALVWDTNTGETKFTVTGHTDSVICAEFNYDSSLVATAGMDGIVQVWNVQSGAKTWDFHTTEVTWMSWHPTSNLLFTTCSDGNSWKWSVPDGAICEVFPTHGRGAVCGYLMSNGTKCVIGYDDGSLKIWDTNNLSALGFIKAHNESVTCVASSADGNVIVSGSEDGTAALIKSSNCKILHSWNFPPSDEHKETVESVAFFKSHPFLAVGTSRGTLNIYDISSYTQRASALLEAAIVKLVCADTAPLVYAASGGDILAYDGRSGELQKKWEGHSLPVLDMAFSSNREKFITASDDFTCKIFST